MEIGFFENKYVKDGAADVAMIQSVISRNKGIRLWILPEVFDTGCNVTPKTEFQGARIIDLFSEWSVKYQTAVCGSFYINDNGKIFNRFCAALPDGTKVFYDKRHLFGPFEKKYVTSGTKVVTFNYLGFKIRPIICYDLRFPVWCRNTDDYDVLLCVSQWPVQRLADRAALCKARAIENQAYVVNVNAQGFSKIESPDCNVEIKQIRGSKSWVKAEIHKEPLDKFRSERRYLADRDSFLIS